MSVPSCLSSWAAHIHPKEDSSSHAWRSLYSSCSCFGEQAYSQHLACCRYRALFWCSPSQKFVLLSQIQNSSLLLGWRRGRYLGFKLFWLILLFSVWTSFQRYLIQLIPQFKGLFNCESSSSYALHSSGLGFCFFRSAEWATLCLSAFQLPAPIPHWWEFRSFLFNCY